MTRYILTQDMKAIIPFMDGDQIKTIKRRYGHGNEDPEGLEGEGPYDIFVYLPDGIVVRGHLGTYRFLTAATDMMSVLFDNLSDDIRVMFMNPDEAVADGCNADACDLM